MTRETNLVSDLIRVIATCDADCLFCNWPHEAHQDFVPPTIEELAALGRRVAAAAPEQEVVLSGGEPLLRRDLEDVVAALKDAGVRTLRIQTNAIKLTPARARALARSGLDRVLVSLHSSRPEIHDRLMGRPGTHARAVAGALAAAEAGLELSCNYVLTQHNAAGLVEDLRWLARTFPTLTHLSLSAAQPHGRAQDNAGLVPRYPEIADQVRAALREADERGLLVNNPYCGLPVCMGWEDHLDQCTEAAEAALRDSRRQPEGLTNWGDKTQLEACGGCEYRGQCGGVWKEYLRVHGPEGIGPPVQRNLEINLGKACNNRCLFCANGIVAASERKWTPLDVVREEMANGRREGCTSLGFLGGEPTLYPWLETAVREAREIGYTRVALCTNGTRLAVDGLVERLVDAGVTRLAISVHSRRAATEDRLTGRPGSFAAKLAGLDAAIALRDAGRLPDNVAVEAVLARPVLKDLVPFVKRFVKHGVDDFRFNVIRPEGQSREDRKMVPRLREVGEALTDLITANEQYLGARVLFGDLPLCVLPPLLLVNRALLSRYVGERLDLDTHVAVYRPQLDEVDRFKWVDRKLDTLKVRVPACARCSLNGVCEGPFRNYVDLYGEAEFQAVPG